MATHEVTVKAGWKTSEFRLTLVTILGSVIAAVASVAPPLWQTLLTALTVAAYSISRGMAKSPPDVVAK